MTEDIEQTAGGEGKTSVGNILKFAGAFVAFMIGSGYASGQEIMQFFTAYGIWSFGGLIIALVLFTWTGKVLMNYGYRHRDYSAEVMGDRCYRYYCGKYFGIFMSWFTPIFLILVCVVMAAGAGATLAQYFGLPEWVGIVGMCVLVFVTNMFGFKKLLAIIGALGPITIIFSIIVAIFAIASNPSGLTEIGSHTETFEAMAHATSDPSWWAFAGILYVAYQMGVSAPFLSQTGATANNGREAKWGAILGGVLFIAAGILMNCALMCYIDDVSQLEVPTLYLANLIGPVMGVIFSIILLDEIYSTAAPMLWTSVNRFAPEGTKYNKLVQAIFNIIVLVIAMSPLSYSELLGIIYPFSGYIGIIFIICVAVRQCLEFYNKRHGLDPETPVIFKNKDDDGEKESA